MKSPMTGVGVNQKREDKATSDSSPDSSFFQTPLYFRNLVEVSPYGFCVVDKNRNILYLNQTGRDICGNNLFNAASEKDKAVIEAAWQRIVLHPEQPVSFRYRIKDTLEEELWIEAIGKNMLSDAAIHAIVMQFRTSTNYIQSPEEEGGLAVKFSQLFNAGIIGIFVSKFDGTFIEANDAFLSLIGYTREELKQGKVQRDIL